jgi:hypothetical protein
MPDFQRLTFRLTRGNCWALSAGMIVDKLIASAPTAELSVTPAHANTPAASGMAPML